MTNTRVTRRANIADVKTGSLEELRNLRKSIVLEIDRRPAITEPQSELLLVSPNGSVYGVAVTDTGELITTVRYQA